MALIERRPPTRNELKWFGLLFAAFCGLLGLLSFWRAGFHPRTASIVFWCVGIGGALLYYAMRPIQRPFYMLWLTLAYPIGWVVSHLVMALVFYGVITPIGLLMRLSGRDPLNRAFDPAATTYWLPHDPGASNARYFQQF